MDFYVFSDNDRSIMNADCRVVLLLDAIKDKCRTDRSSKSHTKFSSHTSQDYQKFRRRKFRRQKFRRKKFRRRKFRRQKFRRRKFRRR